MAEVNMPRLSDTMQEGTIGRWLKQPGDRVEKGEVLVEIETDKATMELESYDSGTLQQILVQPGQTVPIGEIIAIIGAGESPSSAAPAQTATAAQATSSTPATTPAVTTAVETASGNGHATDERLKASPVARRLAAEYGIDLRLVQGTGPGGRILKDNIEAFVQQHGRGAQPAATAPTLAVVPTPTAPQPVPSATPAAPQPVPSAIPAPAAAPQPAPAAAPQPAPIPAGIVEPMSRMRRAIARAMSAAKPGAPHVYVTSEIDMAAAMQLRQQINDSGAAPMKISVNDMVVKATAKALRAFPAMNSSYAADQSGQPGIVHHAQVNVCVAIALQEGLVAPTIFDADTKSLGTIAAEIRDRARRAREGKIKPDELEGGTFTVSNLGMYDVVDFGAVITLPQSAVLAVGSVRKVPVVRNDEIVVGEIMHVTLSSDHRVVDGAVSAQFLQEFKQLMQSPLSLLV